MDVGWAGVLFIWFAFFWPLIVVTVFTISNSDKIKYNTIFFFVSAVACYTVGILMNFPPGSKMIAEAENQIWILLGFSAHSQGFMYTSLIFTFGLHILITYFIYLGFRKAQNRNEIKIPNS